MNFLKCKPARLVRHRMRSLLANYWPSIGHCELSVWTLIDTFLYIKFHWLCAFVQLGGVPRVITCTTIHLHIYSLAHCAHVDWRAVSCNGGFIAEYNENNECNADFGSEAFSCFSFAPSMKAVNFSLFVRLMKIGSCDNSGVLRRLERAGYCSRCAPLTQLYCICSLSGFLIHQPLNRKKKQAAWVCQRQKPQRGTGYMPDFPDIWPVGRRT